MQTVASEILAMFDAGKDLKAFEQSMDLAVTIREASEYDVYRFEDLSSVRVYISDDHEITMVGE